jgi:uncharacterized protein YerC
MAKPLYESLSTDERKGIERTLKVALLFPKQREEMAGLFCDLLTPSERLLLVRRLQVASRLVRGASYSSIRKELGVGWELIRSVHGWLEGKMEAYRSVLPPLWEEKEERRKGAKVVGKKSRRAYDPLTFSAIRKRYPGYFLLVNMLIDNEW